MKPALVLAPVPALLLALLAACGGNDPSDGPQSSGAPSPTPSGASSAPASPGPSTRPAARPAKVVGTVVRGLEVPWGIGFLPDGSALVTERDSGRVLRVVPGRATEVGRIDETAPGSEAGLLGLAVSPDFATDRRVFLYTSTDEDNRVLRARFRDGRLGPAEPILTGIPRGEIHDGGRLAFGPDGFLYVSTGETGDRPLAQDRDTPAGKILRITQDGAAAPGNPFGSPVWTLGHRNVQGLAFDDDGLLWASEFGQDTWDELNLITRGRNYGWPDIEGKGGGRGFTDPQVQWSTDEASPSGLAYLDGHLWLASLRGERLWRITVDGARARAPKAFFVGRYGRMRTVTVAPDGRLWVTTSNRDGRGDPQDGDDRILLVDPGTS